MHVELSVIIPAFNEAATIADVVSEHRAVCQRLAEPFEIIVCDDGSTDGTWDLLQAMTGSVGELRCFRNASNRGITLTMKRLFDLAVGEWYYFAPADGQVPAEALDRMWRVRNGAAVVVGRRLPRHDARSRVVVARLYSMVLRTLYRLPVHDIDSVKLYKTSELRSIAIESDTDFFQAEVLIALHRSGLTLREVNVPHRPRIAGRAMGVTPASAARSIRDLVWFVLRDAGIKG